MAIQDRHEWEFLTLMSRVAPLGKLTFDSIELAYRHLFEKT